MRLNNLSIIISAPSGSGKTTLIKKLIFEKDRFQFVISTTTRPQRKNEIDGENYHFVSTGEFNAILEQDGFLEWNEVHGNLYGITKKEIDRIKAVGRIPVFDVDVKGAIDLKEKIEDSVYIFIVPPSKEVLHGRLKKRQTDSDEQIKLRLANSIEELQKYHLYDYLVINDDLEIAVKHLEAIVTAELCKTEHVSYIIKEILEAENDNTT